MEDHCRDSAKVFAKKLLTLQSFTIARKSGNTFVAHWSYFFRLALRVESQKQIPAICLVSDSDDPKMGIPLTANQGLSPIVLLVGI